MKYILRSLLFLLVAVSPEFGCYGAKNLSSLKAIVRPKVESELSIQDRHPTCKSSSATELVGSKYHVYLRSAVHRSAE
jgi:hypothetical protein